MSLHNVAIKKRRKIKMLKIRIEGKEKEIYDFIELIRNNENYTVNSISRLYRNNATMSIYSRCYIEIEFDHGTEIYHD